ncbi:MAG: nucleotide pyrophosphohydrolase [Nitrospirae bacterium]|nr:nucleotide pyrophosphohydrolase [Nitrospirota bacterium]
MNTYFKGLAGELKEFARERDWEKFHTPKNLAMALSVEVAELVEIFQWMDEEESRTLEPKKLRHLREEIGDVLIYLTNLADKFDIDPLEAAIEKLQHNRDKYPASIVRGKATKYTDYL